MTLKILIADDEAPKLGNISDVISRVCPGVTLTTAKSVKSAIRSLRESRPDLLILDMSLPTFDVAPGEPGGRGQNAGGVEVLRYVRFYKLDLPVIVVTQYGAVEGHGVYESLPAMGKKLLAEHGEAFRGIIHYGSASSGWDEKLVAALSDFSGECR
jgi:CheY-like chemotaxis protein